MADARAAGPTVFGKPAQWALAVCCAALLAIGLAGRVSAAWGYGLFAAATVLIAAGILLFGIFALTAAGGGGLLRRGFGTLLVAGAISYVLAVFALAGHYTHETLAGRMQWHWVLFGPAALAALVILDVGLYRKLVQNNLPTWNRFRQYIRREDADPAAMRQTLIDDVIVQRALYRTSRLRWLRHALIFWGFVGMFAAEMVAVFLREGFPAFGWRDVWREPGHPVRLAFDFVFDLTGLMMLVGCVLALVWRAMVNATPERKYADTPTTLFLLFVVLSGFVLEGLRIAPAMGDPSHAASFVGLAFAWPLAASGLAETNLHKPLWVLHAIAACAFIAYVPVKRLVHTCATPMGRLMYSQKAMLAARKRGVIGAMLRGRGHISTGMTGTIPKR